MVEVDEDRQRLAHDLVGLFPLHIYHETDSTGLVLELRIVETLFFGWSDVFHVATFESNFLVVIIRFRSEHVPMSIAGSMPYRNYTAPADVLNLHFSRL